MRRVSAIALLLACAAGACQAQLHRACISNNGWFYDLRSDASSTRLDRYRGTTFVDSQFYAPFHLPAPGTVTWDEGVGFAATMQTRSAWLNTEPTLGATWVYDGTDTWTFRTTVSGVPTQYVFTTSNCVGVPPPTPPPSAVHRACISNNGWFYDLRSDASSTRLDRYQGTTFVDSQPYAPFHMPAPGTTAWDEGVGFAAAMQTRSAWLNTEPTLSATWTVDPAAGGDVWTFRTTVNGVPTQYVFTPNNCVPPPPPPVRACISNNGWFYDLRSDAFSSRLDRYRGTTFVDSQPYSPLHMPAPGSITWDEGVALAATMETRNAWVNTEPTLGATWKFDASKNNHILSFSTTVGGVPKTFTFETLACLS